MGRSSKAKGAKYERRIVKRHLAAGIRARKVPLSGALDEFPGDLTVLDRFRGEVKARKDGRGFTSVSKWLAENDFLFLQELGPGGRGGGNPEPLVVMPWSRYESLLRLFVEGLVEDEVEFVRELLRETGADGLLLDGWSDDRLDELGIDREKIRNLLL